MTDEFIQKGHLIERYSHCRSQSLVIETIENERTYKATVKREMLKVN